MTRMDNQLDPNITYKDDLNRQLVAAAFDVIAKRYVIGRHQIGSAILSSSGTIYLGIHIEAMVGRASICAEAVALGAARLADESPLIAVASVRYPKPEESGPARVVPPCGLCRELLLDYAPDMIAVVMVAGVAFPTPLADLLPHKYVGTKWSDASGTHMRGQEASASGGPCEYLTKE